MDQFNPNPNPQPPQQAQPAYGGPVPAAPPPAPPQPPVADTLPQEEENPKQKRSWPIRILKAILPLLVIAALVYVVYNFPALWQRLTFAVNPPKPGNSKLLPPSIRGNNATAGGIPVNGPGCGTDPIEYDGNGNPKQICDNYVYIPKIRVAAPIVRPNSTDEATIDDALLQGVVHYPGTAEPGERGNVFLTGHSSFYWWVPTKYRNVFTLEPQLENDDEIIIYKNGTRYSYRVTNKFEVAPNETSVLAQTPDSRVTLSTCVPIGTSYRRMIVQAKQVQPDPNRARVPTSQARQPARLPGVR